MGDVDDDLRTRLAAAYPTIRRFAAVVGPADVEPDDLVQDAFVRVLRRGIDDIANLDAYLRRTVLNLSSNERRSWSRRQRAYRQERVVTETVSATFVDVADLLRLAPDVRAVLWLAEVEGWTHAEIAGLLGCSEEAARARASRGRRRLRLALVEEG
ncbi:MAG: putative polymerase subfamily sigma factor [Acidimicrobiales bacterium]|jgi:RNA polymerase sigma-70 factor (ECF subfamily)|nr:putative polymerase subfamily sigma factor [Acidimicrobiales bacterium]